MKTLRPVKHEQLEFLLADNINISSVRDEIASMEHPFFSLKGGDMRDRIYKNGNVTVIVKSTSSGIATIFDKDIWLYCISKLQQKINDNEPVSRTIVFTPYDFFITTNRDKGGRSYKELEKTLSRLKGTVITTNIKHGDEKQEIIEFGLIDSWRILEEKKGNLNIGMVEVTLPNWLFTAITETKILKISNDYFRIRKAIDRRIYEIARKHCGIQYEFEITLDKLQLKTGSTSTKEKFKFNIKNLAQENNLPDYEIELDVKKNIVKFKNRNPDSKKADAMERINNGKKRLKEIKKIFS
ncbi:replication initiator protein A [Gilliamella sp. Bif1-4]|uniref:replication initiator protein A n=1 Tax=Gilliamella sp. Bif1-4 TaxID=3120233 RepID=UPI0009BFC4F4|nr:replication initiator protein A [Gilliamella apicola]